MVTIDKQEHTDILEQSIKHLEYLGFENIKADLDGYDLSLIHISEPTRQAEISYAVFCLKKKK